MEEMWIFKREKEKIMLKHSYTVMSLQFLEFNENWIHLIEATRKHMLSR